MLTFNCVWVMPVWVLRSKMLAAIPGAVWLKSMNLLGRSAK